MNSKPLLLICIAFICSLTTNAQPAIDINGGPERSRALNTKGLETVPSQVLWKSEKLFSYRASDWIQGTNGPFKFSFDMPSNQYFTAPIIANDLLYFTYGASDGYLYAIEKATGQKLVLLKLDQNSVSRPAAKDNLVFFGSGKGQVHAYDARKKTTKSNFQDKDHSFAVYSPVLDRDLLYFFAYDRGLYAFVADTGEVKWMFKFTKVAAPVAVAGDRVILLTTAGRMMALDRETGATQWDVSVGRDTDGPSVLGDQIFLVYADGEVRSYSAVDGALQWKSKDVPRSGTALALHKGMVYYGGRDLDVLALDASTGAEKLRFKTKRACHGPLIAGDLLYVRCQDNRLYALSTSTLQEVWRLQNGDSFPPPVVFADGVMYSLDSKGYLYAVR